MMNRRQFLATSAGIALSRFVRASQSAATSVTVTLVPQRASYRIPADFLGLGYEISSVAQAGLLSGKNRRLIEFVRTLSPAGVIRIGGNTSDDAHWSADGQAVSAPKGTAVNRQVISGLGDFLRASGWRLIWGLNLGSGSADEALAEAQAVAKSAGPALLAFEIGNEPDIFAPAHRKRGYGYGDFLAEYRTFKKLIRSRIPDAPFAGPDAANATQWVEQFAKDEGSDLKLLTHHYYAQGPPQRPSTTIENLLAGKTGIEKKLDRISAASQASHVPYRFCEVNSCFHGGKPGVSDTFASALWAMDFMFILASHGCRGINIETGMNQLGRISDYSPIYPDGPDGYIARPIYYGMLAFARSLGGTLIECNLEAGGLNAKAYAVRAENGSIGLTLINKELTRPAKVRIAGGAKAGNATVCRLTAPSAASLDNVTLCGMVVNADGGWRPARSDSIDMRDGQFEVDLPPASALVLNIA